MRDTKAEAVEALRDVLVWELPQAQWLEVERAVEALAAAVADRATLEAAVYGMDCVGPSRLAPIGSKPLLPAPERVRERVNHLIHSLGGNGSTDRRRARDDPPAGR